MVYFLTLKIPSWGCSACTRLNSQVLQAGFLQLREREREEEKEKGKRRSKEGKKRRKMERGNLAYRDRK